MNYCSTAGRAPASTLASALRTGLAPDGGLYVPDRLPGFAADAFANCTDLPETAAVLLKPYFADSELENQLADICAESLGLPLPIVDLDPGRAWMLELFHGPTAAFKDFAARFLAACMARLRTETDPTQTVMVEIGRAHV